MNHTQWSLGREIYGRQVRADVGSYVEPDGWRNWGALLLPGDLEPIGDGWRGCDFRLPSQGGNLACNVEVTGRTFRRRGGELQARVRIEWVQDGAPSEYSGGWMRVAW